MPYLEETMEQEIILEARNITKVYPGGVVANHNVNLQIKKGEIHALVGENGAGKSTLMKMLFGMLAPTEGQIFVDGKEVHFSSSSDAIAAGLGMVHQHFMQVPSMTVAENLAMGAYFRKDKKAIADDLERVYARFPRLNERAKQLAGTLSGGEQQMLAMGRAIMSAPKLIVMDEPSMGLSPVLVQEVFSIIGTMHELGITILLVEQNAKMALAIADRAYVLENGRITMSGGARDLLHDDKVRKAYLGA